ncbi:SusE domain-containing protein [Lutibacter sp. TH_r2]|uniref:SusE domain-containing protein n=1 Tax=Lutibacter sp. TH_r2 TaxID=3082083 RepID=UPI0029546B4A|nr:SusE domain-containing protein [Lutibacter sp. TH_r2]MDV7188554.1 SusE domain-containing protein [Lutibacter sp. TH_r2]
MMKYLNKIIILLAITFGFISCDKNENFEILPAQESFQIVAPSSGSVLVLNDENPANIALFLSWETLSGASGPYTVEMDLEDTFSSSITLGSSDEKSFSLTVEEFNQFLLDAGIKVFAEMPIYIRVSSSTETTEYISLVVTTFPSSNPIITSPDSTFEVILSDITPDDTAITTEWTDADFDESSTVSVTYEIEVAEAGTSFASTQSLGTTEDYSLETTHSALNEAALALGITVGEVGELDLRVKASFETAAGTSERFSELITISVTPYETALPETLYIVGAGAPDAGWGWTSPVELTLLGTTYSGNVNLQSTADANNFRFFTEFENWDSGQNYPYYEVRGYTIDTNLVNAEDGDNNFAFIGTDGEYFLSIDTENKVITLGPPMVGPNCEFDQLWLVGAGVPDAGWGWDSPVQLPCTGTGIYAGNVNLQSTADANNFRFFTVENDWGSGQNYPYYVAEGYTIDANFEDAADGDNNFAFIGTTGNYYLSVDTINKVITLGPPQTSCEFDQLYLVGAGVPDAGWGWDSPVQLPCTGAGVYSGSVNLTNDAFRFFTVENDWGSGQNYPYYIAEGYTIDASFEDAADGDNNFKFIGTPGTYTLTLDTVNKVITLE